MHDFTESQILLSAKKGPSLNKIGVSPDRMSPTAFQSTPLYRPSGMPSNMNSTYGTNAVPKFDSLRNSLQLIPSEIPQNKNEGGGPKAM